MKKTLRVLISSACELLESGLSARETFRVLSDADGADPFLRAACREIAADLYDGHTLSDSVSCCTVLPFPRSYCALLSCVEGTGDAARAFSFMREDSDLCARHRERVAGALVYPVFVVLLALFLSLALSSFGSSLVTGVGIDCTAGIAQGLLFLVAASSVLATLIALCLSRNERYDVCRLLHFLLSQRVPLVHAVRNAVLLCRDGSASQRLLVRAASEIESGVPVPSALGALHPLCPVFLSLSEQTGDMSRAFGQIASAVQSEQKRKEALCLSLLEPSMIVTVAVYIIILLRAICIPMLISTLTL